MFNKKILAAALAMSVSGVTFADIAGDSHTVGITMPAVALLDIGTNTVNTSSVDTPEYTDSTFVCALVTADAAGSGMECTTTNNVTMQYSITVNTPATGAAVTPAGWILKAGADDNLDPSWKLVVEANVTAVSALAGAANGFAGTPTAGGAVLDRTQDVAVVSGIVNAATTGNTLTYSLGQVDPTIAMASTSGSQAVVVAYEVVASL